MLSGAQENGKDEAKSLTRLDSRTQGSGGT